MPDSFDTSHKMLAPMEKIVDDYIANVAKNQTASDYTLNKLDQLISDRITSDNDSWISHELHNLLRDLSDNGYVSFDLMISRVQDLPNISRILQFVAHKAKNVEEYETHLKKLLELCKMPPLLQNTGTSLQCTVLLEQHFDTLANLISVLASDANVSKVLNAISCLLERSDDQALPLAVKPDHCLVAAERSGLPTILVDLVETSSGTIYQCVLEVVFLLVSGSDTSCCRMLEARILDRLIVRMDLTDPHRKADERLIRDKEMALWRECTIAATDIAWVLIQWIPFLGKFAADSQNPPVLGNKATRSLTNILRRQIREGDATLRNNLAALILSGLVALPSWDITKSGLAEVFVALSIARESGTSGEFRTSNEDDRFLKKIALSILCQLCDRCGGAFVAIMKEQGVMSRVLELMESPLAQSRCLSDFAMRILARLVPKMPKEFTVHKGALRLARMIAERSSLTVVFDSRVIMELTKTVCDIITLECCPLVLESFHEADIVVSLIELVNRILSFDRLTMEHQRILTLLIATIEEMASESKPRNCPVTGSFNRVVEMLPKLLERCSFRRKHDFQLDQRLLIAIGSCTWKCIVSCIDSAEEFVENGGIYVVLDIIENACLPVRSIYLGLLADLCSIGQGVVSQLCTWRGVNKSEGFVSLLAKSWREEEIRMGVKRTSEGFIDDPELPIMGTEQWMSAFYARASYDFSPTLASMLGSVRARVYALRKLMKHDIDQYQMSMEHYKILSDDTKTEELTTMCIADHLYRFCQGQVWSEVSRYLEQRGVNLLGMDGETMILMNDRHCGWAMYVRGLQDALLRAKRKKEAERELAELAKIRDSKLGSSLSALEKIHYIRKTTDYDYMIRMKKSQRNETEDTF